jgi:hypothetical protein
LREATPEASSSGYLTDFIAFGVAVITGAWLAAGFEGSFLFLVM